MEACSFVVVVRSARARLRAGAARTEGGRACKTDAERGGSGADVGSGAGVAKSSRVGCMADVG